MLLLFQGHNLRLVAQVLRQLRIHEVCHGSTVVSLVGKQVHRCISIST